MSKKSAIFIVLIVCAAYTFAPSMFSAPQHSGKEQEQKLIEKRYKELQSREEAIQKELSSLQNHPWAGEYNTSDGLTGKRLFVAPKTGFSFLWHCCEGPCDLNYGDVKFENGVLKTISALPNRRDSFQGIDSVFYPIFWGNRHYLIAEDEMIDFCNSVNAGFEPASGTGMLSSRYLVKIGDENKQSTGLPPVPRQFAEYLLSKPIKAQIVSIDSTHIEEDELGPEFKLRVTVVTVDAGYTEGVRPGMNFHTSAKDIAQDAEVTQVSEHSCKAEMTIFVESKNCGSGRLAAFNPRNFATLGCFQQPVISFDSDLFLPTQYCRAFGQVIVSQIQPSLTQTKPNEKESHND